MQPTDSTRRTWSCTGIILVLAAAVCFADKAGKLTPVRMTLHNALSPGRLLVRAVSPSSRTIAAAPKSQLSDTEISELQNALLQNELQRRQLLIENARLHNELRAMKRLTSVEAVTGHDLIDFIALKTTVLSHSGLSGGLAEAFIDAGKADGLLRSQLVVDGAGLLVDKGKDHGVAPGQKVAHGTAVIGRVAEVSQWVGLVQPVTHAEFSAAVQIVKLAPQGASFGAKGLLEGTGNGDCRITGIPYTDAVAVGDEVFSADINGVKGPRLYYGTVVYADFTTGGQWDIRVEPVFRASDLNEVAIIQHRLNADRTQMSERPRRSNSHGAIQ